MKKEIMTCDICDREFPVNGRQWEYSLHLQAGHERHFYGTKEDKGKDMDICGKCFDFIRAVNRTATGIYLEFRKAFERMGKMCPADKEIFAKNLRKQAEKQDRYYKA